MSPRNEILAALARGLAGGAWEDPENLRRELAGIGLEAVNPSFVKCNGSDSIAIGHCLEPGASDPLVVLDTAGAELTPENTVRAASLLLLHAIAAEQMLTERSPKEEQEGAP